MLFAKSPLPLMRVLRLGRLKPRLGPVAGAVELDTFAHAYHYPEFRIKRLVLEMGVCRPLLAVEPLNSSRKSSCQRFANGFPFLAVIESVETCFPSYRCLQLSHLVRAFWVFPARFSIYCQDPRKLQYRPPFRHCHGDR